MKKLTMFIAFVVILSLSIVTAVTAQRGVTPDIQRQATTYTTTQGDTLSDLLDEANIDVGRFAVGNDNPEIARLRSFVNNNQDLAFEPGADLVIPQSFDTNDDLGELDQVTLGDVDGRFGLLDDDTHLRDFVTANMDAPVAAGQTVVLRGVEDTPDNNQNAQNNPGAIPQTGGQNSLRSPNAPIFGSALTSWSVYGRRGELTGEVRGFIVDTVNGQVPYIVVLGDSVLSYHTVLIPWGAFDIIDNPQSQGFFGLGNNANDNAVENAGRLLDPSRDMGIQLNITETQFENAPGFDMSEFDDNVDLSPGWDTDDVDYWNNTLTDGNFTPHENTDGLMLIESGIFDQIDFELVNTNGDNFGEIEHLLINQDGSLRYALLEPDNLDLGLNDEFVVVSLRSLTWVPDDGAFVINAPEGALVDAPVFDPNALPDFATPGWDSEWNNHWSQYDAQSSTTGVPVTGDGVHTGVRRNAIVGDTIYYGADDSRLGTVQDVVTGDNGQVEYVVTYDSNTDQFHAIPFDMFRYDANNDYLTYEGDIDQFQNAPGYDNMSDIDTSQPGWNDEIDNYWLSQ